MCSQQVGINFCSTCMWVRKCPVIGIRISAFRGVSPPPFFYPFCLPQTGRLLPLLQHPVCPAFAVLSNSSHWKRGTSPWLTRHHLCTQALRPLTLALARGRPLCGGGVQSPGAEGLHGPRFEGDGGECAVRSAVSWIRLPAWVMRSCSSDELAPLLCTPAVLICKMGKSSTLSESCRGRQWRVEGHGAQGPAH